jgi:hypothetical protein
MPCEHCATSASEVRLNLSRVVDSNTSPTLAGQAAYIFVFEYTTSSGLPVKAVETGTIVGSKVYYIQTLIDADQYFIYIPTVQKMIYSFTIS